MAEKSARSDAAVRLLRDKAETLRAVGENRLPRRSDFPPETVVQIKALFGPWPHALAAAGLLETSEEARREKNRKKRARARQKAHLPTRSADPVSDPDSEAAKP